MLRKTVFLLALLFILVFSCSIPVHAQSDQEIAAVNFLKFLGSSKQILSAEAIEANELAPKQHKVFTGRLIHLTDGGYIIVSASTSLTPVKAYSLSGSFEALPEPYRKFLLRELEYNIRTLAAAKTLQPAAISENQQRWDFLLRFGTSKTPYAYTPDTFLLTTKWNQGYPFNKFLPEINGTNVLAGCVNVAVGQLLKYYDYPATGNGVESYTWNGQQLKTILYRNYTWENMPDLLDSTTPEYKADEVALLMKDLGIVNHTSFSLTDSGASINTNALIENFGFSNTIQQMGNSNAVQFFNRLKVEIDALRPVLLQFPGHMTVADGYASDGAGKKIHVNMGWGGIADNYYFLDQNVNAGGYTFPPNLYIYYNVKPCNGADCSLNLEQGDAINGLNISGNFNYDRDADRYKIYLKGTTALSASRNWVYSNIGFFIYLYNDSDGSVVFSADGNGDKNTQLVVGDLAAGRYTVKISLYNNGGNSLWGYDVANPGYSVSISSGPLTSAEKSWVDSSLNVGPVIFSSFNDMILNSTAPQPYKILIDARDKNGDVVTLTATNTNNSAVLTDVSKNILSITPVGGASRVASKITVTATANGKTAEKSFVVMLLNEDIAFGKSFTVSGLFKPSTNIDKHKVVLDGACSITGFRGCSPGQGFFSSVMDTNQNFVSGPTDSSINDTFSGSLYLVGASTSWGGTTWTCPADTSGSYTLTVTCPSANDSVASIAQMIGVDLSGALGGSHLTLNAGWNFISTPNSPVYPAIGTVLNDISPNVRVVWGYDNNSKAWLKYKGQGSEGQNTLTTIEPGKGYWIYMDSSANLTVAGSDASPTIHLYPGWNLVGYNGTDNRDLGSSLTSIPGKWSVIWCWDLGVWYGKHETIPTLPAPIEPLSLMHRGKAYWIKAKEAAEWSQ